MLQATDDHVGSGCPVAAEPVTTGGVILWLIGRETGHGKFAPELVWVGEV